MDVLQLATQWAKAEVFSSKFFIVAAVLFIAASIGFWQLGKSDLAKSFIVPTLVCGLMVLTIGVGLVYNNQTRVKAFAEAYHENKEAFVASEIERTEGTIAQTERTIFVIIPIMIMVAALLIIFVDKPAWRASTITAIAMLIVLLLVDSNSHSRIVTYHKELTSMGNTSVEQPG